MKKFLIGLVLVQALLGCASNNNISSSYAKESLVTSTTSSKLVTSEASSTSTVSSSSSKISSSSKSSSSKVISSSKNNSSSKIESSSKVEKNPDGSNKMEMPQNKSPLELGSDNASMTSFDFSTSLPDYFRFIYGNNFTNPPFYSETAGGGLKISNFTNAKQGFQTCLFTANKKLEIRLQIGGLFNNSQGNKVDKDLPVVVIYGFSNRGVLLRQCEIMNIDKSDENSYKRVYMDGNDVAYLEFRFLQPAYKSSQGYNIAVKGLDLIAWPYEL